MKRYFILILLTLCIIQNSNSQVRIKMQKEDGVYTTPCVVNGLKLRFIFDTGASDVSISLSEAYFMLKNGYLNKNDLVGSSYSQLADGDIIENTSVVLREFEVGGIVLRNVKANIVHELNAPLLLGQSALTKLGKILIEDEYLTILNFEDPSGIIPCEKARNLKKAAREHELNKLYALSSDLYQKAYDICPQEFSCFELDLIGGSFFLNSNFSNAIKYYQKALLCENDLRSLFFIHFNLEECYYMTGDIDKAKLNIQKALSLAKSNDDFSFCYFRLGILSGVEDKNEEAIEFYNKRIEYYLKSISASEDQIMKGEILDLVLGETYYNISIHYLRLNLLKKSEIYVIKSALCGYDRAIEHCQKNNIIFTTYVR